VDNETIEKLKLSYNNLFKNNYIVNSRHVIKGYFITLDYESCIKCTHIIEDQFEYSKIFNFKQIWWYESGNIILSLNKDIFLSICELLDSYCMLSNINNIIYNISRNIFFDTFKNYHTIIDSAYILDLYKKSKIKTPYMLYVGNRLYKFNDARSLFIRMLQGNGHEYIVYKNHIINIRSVLYYIKQLLRYINSMCNFTKFSSDIDRKIVRNELVYNIFENICELLLQNYISNYKIDIKKVI
jgi:hypothetical protein